MVMESERDVDFFKEGLEFHNRGEYKKAIKMYKKALETSGLDKKTLVLLGNVYYMNKRSNKAEDSYLNALSLDLNYSKAYFNLGVIYDGAKNYGEAIKAFKKTIELEDDFAEAYANLGDVYRSLGDLEDAVLNYDKALEIDGKVEQAIKGLNEVPKTLVEKVRNRELMNRSDELIRTGIGLERSGNTLAAAEKYRESLRVFSKSAAGLILLESLPHPPGGPVSKKDLGFLGLETKAICESISPEVQEFLGKKLGDIRFEQKSMKFFFNRLKESLKKKRGKLDLIGISRTILFDEPERGLSKALELELKGETEKAKRRYKRVIERASYLVHAYLLYGLFLEQNNEESEALSMYLESSKHAFNYLNEDLISHIVELFSRRPGFGHLKEIDPISIVEEFRRNLQEGEAGSLLRFIRYKLSLEAEARIKYGFEKEESGKSSEAINAYEDAINVDPENPLSHYVLGLAYETRGLKKEAMAEYEKTRGADFVGIESSGDISRIVEHYFTKTTKDGHRVGAILERYFEIIAEDPEHMLELLGFIEDLKIESVSRIIKSYISTDVILGSGRVVRDQMDFGSEGKDGYGGGKKRGSGSIGKVVRDGIDFGEDLDRENEKIEKSRAHSKISFDLLWKYKTQRSIRCVAGTKDGRMILAGSENGIIYSINQNAKSTWRHDSGASVVDIDISPDGRLGIFCNSNGVVELLDCSHKGSSLWLKDFSRGGVNSVAISLNASTIAVATNNFRLFLYDLEGNELASYTVDQIIKKLDISDDGTTIIAASENRLYLIVNGGEPERLSNFKPYETIQSIFFSEENNLIAVGTRGGSVYLLNRDGEVQWRDNVMNPVYGVSVSSDGKVVSGAMNGTITLYSKEGERLWKYFTGENIWDVDISDDGQWIISGCGLVFGNIYLFKMG